MAENYSEFGDAAHRTLVVGLGSTGVSCARYLTRKGIPFVVTDSRANPPGLAQLLEFAPQVECYLGGFDEFVFAQAQSIVISPGLSLKKPIIAQALARNAAIYGDIELFVQEANAPVIAITGSNGKSTVTSLLGEMATQAGLNAKVGGNIGTPALDLLEEDATAVDFYILELSSFQLETTQSLQAHAAVVLNVSADHMDRYNNLSEYAVAKKRVYQGAKNIVVNRNDDVVMQMLDASINLAPGNIVSFGLDQPPSGQFGLLIKDREIWLAKGDEMLLNTRAMRLAGSHNHANALAALALGESMGMDMQCMLQTLRSYKGLPHRMQFVAEVSGVRWYNDSKGTNVGATVSAISGMQGAKILLLGGDGKGADFEPLREAIIANNVRAVVLLGRDAPLIERAIQGVVQIKSATDMAQAVAIAHSLAKTGDCVILSPACASFDMFDNYQHRGDVYSDLVKGLVG